ncbi:MAG TPA: response regulator [Bacteroidota bacterium]|nr:response regulator [Bacteroidota bacterium]
MRNICIVDDDEEIVRILTTLLEGEGYSVSSANDAAAGWNIIQKKKPAILIVDWQMRQMSGIELIKHVKSDAALSNTYIIMISGKSETDDIVHGLDSGADEYLPKPFKLDELSARIRSGVRIRELEGRISEETKKLTVYELALSVADKIGNPLAVAKLRNELLAENSIAKSNPEITESVEIIGKMLQEALELIRKVQLLKSPRSIPAPGGKTMIDLNNT